MSADRFVLFKGESRPNHKDLYTILHDYVGGGGTLDILSDRVIVDLPGKPSFPFKSIYPHIAMACECQETRWFEVWLSQDCLTLDVITRMQDEYTSSIADGFVRLCVRFWGGTMGLGESPLIDGAG